VGTGGKLVGSGFALYGERAVGDGAFERARFVQDRREVARVFGRVAEEVQLLVELSIAQKPAGERGAGEQGFAEGNERDRRSVRAGYGHDTCDDGYQGDRADCEPGLRSEVRAEGVGAHRIT